ncbi:DNA-directed RNA polymerase subunit beta' [Candidatus Saccharibacteria bacterium]|nr:DNA-directed RNA polymerase subunit beta' [Candidatus Saccharibacteria bacterium]
MNQYIGTDDFDAVRLGVASANDIMSWSFGEILKPETINYRTQKPERDGLFCERIFGPVKDINPNDPRIKGVRSREMAVDRDGNLVTKSIARRERMGHIKLAVPVAHIWFMRGVPSTIGQILDMTVKDIERVVYFAAFMITDVDEEERQKLVSALEENTVAARDAIKMRYEEMRKVEGANVEELNATETKESEEFEKDYQTKKQQLEKLVRGGLMSEMEYNALSDEHADLIRVEMGAKAIAKFLANVDVAEMVTKLNEESEKTSGLKAKRIAKRLKTFESLAQAGISPNDLILTILPVIPPDLRPIISLSGGRFAVSDLNDLYRRVINRNNRLKRLLELRAPEVICRNEMRMLQEAVDALVDGSNPRSVRAANAAGGRRRRLKSLADILKGKQGRFRQNLLGKRVDYSGRSVIVVGPELKIDQCGLPKHMALELFRPFVVSWLVRGEHASSVRAANNMIDAQNDLIWDALDDAIQGRYVLLNRAPSLHRLSIQAFQPKLVEGHAIRLHPLVAEGFNADYDGDQMAVHLPLSAAAQEEAKTLVSSVNNLIKPADGEAVLAIYQDVVLGAYYATMDTADAEAKPIAFSSLEEAELAFDRGTLALQTPIRVEVKGEMRETTWGRILLNECLPADFPYENSVMTSKRIKALLREIFEQYDNEEMARTADNIKALSFKYETYAGISTSKDDYIALPESETIIAEAEGREALIADQFNNGLLNEEERYKAIVSSWREADAQIKDLVSDKLKGMNTDISLMVNSGARGSASNVKLASAMIGIMVDVYNHEIELPVRGSFKSGLSPLESFVASRGARQGLVSTALKTADSGYLTRRLVDVAQDIFTDDIDNSTDPGYAIHRAESELTMIAFADRLKGRFAAEEVGGYIQKGELITPEIALSIEKDSSVESVKIESILTTPVLDAVPRTAYGYDMAKWKTVDAHQPVGVIAAQSVGEPGTQLTLDTFHSSGVAGSGAVAQGLPRVEELLEARTPKGQALMATVDGTVEITQDGATQTLTITPTSGKVETLELNDRKAQIKDGKNVKAGDILAAKDEGKNPLIAPFAGNVQLLNDKIILTGKPLSPVNYVVSSDINFVVKNGDSVEAGDRLTLGSLNLQDLMKHKGIEATERYILNEVLRIYAAQGQNIADKHLEIIVRQMFSRVIIDEPRDSHFIAGEIRSLASVVEANKKLVLEGKQPAEYTRQILGITKVAVYSDSFLSAASFQDTTRVLIRASISGQVDNLRGLKENVIIGRKIPVGTGVTEAA